MSDPTADSDKVRTRPFFKDIQSTDSRSDPEQETGQVTTVPVPVPVLTSAVSGQPHLSRCRTLDIFIPSAFSSSQCPPDTPSLRILKRPHQYLQTVVTTSRRFLDQNQSYPIDNHTPEAGGERLFQADLSQTERTH